MAGVSVKAEVLLAKRVQEMILDGEAPLGPYICRDAATATTTEEDSSSSPSPIPIIDLSLLLSSSTDQESEEELSKLRSALSSWGCFLAIGHGISVSFLDEMRQMTKEFFGLPMEEKKKLAKTVTEFEGYGGDPVPEDGQPLDWSDRLFLSVYPEDRRNLKFWPQYPKPFRGILEEYMEMMRRVTEQTSKAMAKSLNLEEKCFLNQFGERATLDARFNYYLSCQRPDLVLGLKPHSDGTGYTIILQDQVGLQVLKDDKWFTVPNVADAVLVLVGDQMEIMSNGIFKSVVHRVLTTSKDERMSVVVFHTPEEGREIGPEDGLISEGRPRLYKNVRNYADIHWGYYQRGERALHSVRFNPTECES